MQPLLYHLTRDKYDNLYIKCFKPLEMMSGIVIKETSIEQLNIVFTTYNSFYNMIAYTFYKCEHKLSYILHFKSSNTKNDHIKVATLHQGWPPTSQPASVFGPLAKVALRHDFTMVALDVRLLECNLLPLCAVVSICDCVDPAIVRVFLSWDFFDNSMLPVPGVGPSIVKELIDDSRYLNAISKNVRFHNV